MIFLLKILNGQHFSKMNNLDKCLNSEISTLINFWSGTILLRKSYSANVYQNFKLVEITFIRSLFDQVIQQVLELHGLVPHEFEQHSASGKLQYPKPTKKSCLIFELHVLIYLLQKSCCSRSSPFHIVTKITFCQCVSKFQIS